MNRCKEEEEEEEDSAAIPGSSYIETCELEVATDAQGCGTCNF